jgi:hypothetical protein
MSAPEAVVSGAQEGVEALRKALDLTRRVLFTTPLEQPSYAYMQERQRALDAAEAALSPLSQPPADAGADERAGDAGLSAEALARFIAPWTSSNFNSAEAGRRLAQYIAALPPEAQPGAPERGEVERLRAALEQAVDAMEFYMLPSAMDGGIGECAVLMNTRVAIERARVALQAGGTP